MNLLAEEMIIWTVPASVWAKRKVKALNGTFLNGKTKQAERDKLEEELPKLTQYRMTLTSVTMREEGQREALLKSVRDWFEETYEISIQSFNRWFLDKWINRQETDVEYERGDSLSREEANAIFALIVDIANWASLIVCLRCLEMRKVSMLTEADDDVAQPWAQVSIPDEWLQYHKFVDIFPRPLFREAVEICNELNPGVWYTQMDGDSKNFGGVNVHG